jgi:hypothetical protein
MRGYMVLLLGAVCANGSAVQGGNNFSGNWVFNLGKRTLLVVVIKSPQDREGRLTGWLYRSQHLSAGGAGEFFSDIEGPVVRRPVVEAQVKGNCLVFATRNPKDKSDKDDFRLCPSGSGHATLKIELPGFEPWPVTNETGPWAVATDWDSSRTYFAGDTAVSNPEMKQIFEADQKDRLPGIANIDWAAVGKRDAARRKRVRELLAAGSLHTGEDFEGAAFVFQHGGTPDDYLMAHTLAMIAVARGRGTAIWIAAASLDRYLHSIHQPQIYGTQFSFQPGQPVTQEPYNRSLIPDSLRHDLGVPSQAEQEKKITAETAGH